MTSSQILLKLQVNAAAAASTAEQSERLRQSIEQRISRQWHDATACSLDRISHAYQP